MPEEDLPLAAPPGDGPPAPSRWAERDPVAARRLARARAAVAAVAEQHRMPVENLVPPDAVRRLAWTPPAPVSEETVAAALSGYGARSWQVTLTAAGLAGALPEPAPEPAVPAP
jgi:ribonuclease D